MKIIAELGCNHNGDMNVAKQLIKSAKENGANYVKFQTYKTEDFIWRRKREFTYHQHGEPKTINQYEFFKSHELSHSQFCELVEFCQKINMKWFTTPTISRIQEAIDLGSPILKCGSDELSNLNFIKALRETGKPLYISTGLVTGAELTESLALLRNYDVTLFHCTSQYPTNFENAHLNRIRVLKSFLTSKITSVGYSDHTIGPYAAMLASAMNVNLFEKHITLDLNMPGPDHGWSLPVSGLRSYIDHIISARLAMGAMTVDHEDKEMESRAQWMK